MVSANNLLGAAKDIGKYVFITFGTYFGAVIVFIVMGFVEESVLPALGLNTSGTAYTNITGLFTAAYLAITTIVGIVTVITGLLTLNVVLKAFGINLSMEVGMGRSRV